MQRRIKNQMNGVFIHVSDLKRAVKWYSDYLGLELNINEVQSPVFNIPLVGTISLTLDDHTFDPYFEHRPGSGPVFNFHTENIDEGYRYTKAKGIEIVREIEWVGETAWFNIKDLDGNVLMICNS